MNKIFSYSVCLSLLTLALLSGLSVSGQFTQESFNEIENQSARGDGVWDYVDTITKTVQIPAGEKFYLYFDNQTMKLKTMPIPKLPEQCQEALEIVPEWLFDNLTYKFRQLSTNDQITYANLIIDSPDPKYIDEIAFCIAHTSIEGLKNQYTYPQLFTDNAKYIYENDKYLDYVKLVEKSDYTTISYKNKTGMSLEVPRDIYYWYVVHPKLSDELATYVDPDYDYTKHSPFNRNYGASPPNGKFWREWLFYHNDTGQNISHPNSNKSTYKSNPLLKDLLANASNIWEGISAINSWISNSMIFNSDNERPIQPVRIYRKHMGRCGEHQDIRCAAARAGLIPSTCTLNSAEDHVWDEFWDQRWIHWDGDTDNPMKYENGWGKKISTVWNCRGDGYIWSVTNKYSSTCTFTAKVLDKDGLPVDGAEVLIGTQNYYDPNYLTITTWGSTDYTGLCTIELGDSRDYWSSADTDNLGEDPADSGVNEQLTQVITNSVTSQSYSQTFNLPKAAPKLKLTDAELPNDIRNKYKMEIDYQVESNILQGVHTYTREHYDLFSPSGDIDFFIADDSNFYEYNTSQPFSAFEYNQRAEANDIDFILPTDDNWYAVLSNEFSQRTTKIVKITMEIFGTLNVDIRKPIDGSVQKLDKMIILKGTTFSPLPVSSVEVKIDDGGIWQWATDVFDTDESSWSTWKYNWDTKGLAPGKHVINVKAKDTKSIVEMAINVTLVDVTSPEININQPLNNASYKIGEDIKISGTIIDNVGISSVELIIDFDSESKSNITKYLSKGKLDYILSTDELLDGERIVTILAYDKSNNIDNMSIPIKIIEIIKPVVTIYEPINNSAFKQGSIINFRGKSTDNKDVEIVEIIFNDNDPINITSSLSKSGYWNYIWYTNELSIKEGVYNIEIRAFDAARNIGSEKIILSLDNTPPIVNIASPVDNEIFNAGDLISFNGISFDNFEISKLEFVIDQSITIDITDNLIESNWSFNLSETGSMKSGLHNLTTRATDQVGFISESSIFIRIDAELPEVEIEVQILPILIGSDVIFEGSVSDDIGIDHLEFYVNDKFIDNVTILNHPLNEIWNYEWSSSNLTEGTYTIKVLVTDLVNKQSDNEISFKLISQTTDTDGDGMPDWWELLYERLDHTKNDAKKDYDKDGISNLDEYLGDDGKPGNDDYSDPTNKSSIPLQEESKAKVKGFESAIFWILLVVIVIIILLVISVLFRKKKTKLSPDESKGSSEPQAHDPQAPTIQTPQPPPPILQQKPVQQMPPMKQMPTPLIPQRPPPFPMIFPPPPISPGGPPIPAQAYLPPQQLPQKPVAPIPPKQPNHQQPVAKSDSAEK